MTNNSYLPHKTFVLNTTAPVIQAPVAVEKKELATANNETVLEKINSFSNIENKKMGESKTVSPVLPVNEKQFNTVAENVNKPVEPLKEINVATVPAIQNSNVKVIYPAHKTVVLNANGADAPTPLSVKNVTEEKINNTIVQNSPPAGQVGTIENKTVPPVNVPPVIKNENISLPKETLNENSKKESLENENAKSLQVNTTKTSSQINSNYPQHKTFILGVDDIKTPELDNIVKPTENKNSTINNVSIASEIKKEEVKSVTVAPVEEKKPEVVVTPAKKEEAIRTQPTHAPQVAIANAKKPVLWIVLAGVFFLMLLGLGWFTFMQYNKVTALSAENEDLKEAVKRTAIDKLHFDDIIARGGTVDAKNNINILESAKQVEIIRTCYSIGASTNVASGKKEVYIRILDAKNNVLSNSKNKIFEYKGKQMPYSLKDEVDFANEEILRTLDFKVDKKITNGTYKVEIYNDGVLDGTATFELR